jgi:genome maintenance exonuclease 1
MKTFNHVKLPQLDFDLQAVTTEKGRRYTTPDGNAYPSITTVLASYNKKAIMEWRERVGAEEATKISTKASNRGTRFHSICESYLLNEMSPMKLSAMMPDIKEMFVAMREHLDYNISDVYALEQALYSHNLKIAGRVDCIAKWKGQPAIIDFKTANKAKEEDWIENYFMQCTAYAMMFEELAGIPINNIVVAIAVGDGTIQIFEKEKERYILPLMRYIHKYEIESQQE